MDAANRLVLFFALAGALGSLVRALGLKTQGTSSQKTLYDVLLGAISGGILQAVWKMPTEWPFMLQFFMVMALGAVGATALSVLMQHIPALGALLGGEREQAKVNVSVAASNAVERIAKAEGGGPLPSLETSVVPVGPPDTKR